MAKQRRAKIWASAAALGLLLTVIGTTAAGALSCNNCVDSGDIVNGTVRGSDIAAGTIQSSDIANSGIAGSDLGPSAKTAVGETFVTGSVTSSTASTVDSFTVTVPSTGRLYLNVAGLYYFDLNNADAAEDMVNGYLALCTAAASLSVANCGNAVDNVYFGDPDNANSTNQTFTIDLTRVIPVTAGVKTFYVNGRSTDNATTLYFYGGPSFDGARATALFVPGTLAMSS